MDLVEREIKTIGSMIAIYCRGNHHTATSGMCAQCQEVISYAYQRLDSCTYSNSPKPVCGLCPTNCFSQDMHHLFGQVMRYAGPRMMVRHPLLTLAHVMDALRWKMYCSRRTVNG